MCINLKPNVHSNVEPPIKTLTLVIIFQVSKQMIKFTGAITRESIIDMEAKVVKAPEEIKNCSQKLVELQITKVTLFSTICPLVTGYF